MNGSSTLKIALAEKFLHLPNAPIVEAVFEIRARADAKWEEGTVRSYFEPKLSGYEYLDAQRQFQQEWEMKEGQPPLQAVKDLGVKGVRFKSADNLHVVQLNRDGFVLSRLQPYKNWKQFSTEALRLWKYYSELAQPAETNRIGLRFINRIQLPPRELRFEDYIQPAPQPPRGLDQLPYLGFMHHNVFAVPGHPYAVTVVQTIQAPQNLQTEGIALILDIDVFTTTAFQIQKGMVEQRLAEMRWLKNKMFFGSITPKALESFK